MHPLVPCPSALAQRILVQNCRFFITESLLHVKGQEMFVHLQKAWSMFHFCDTFKAEEDKLGLLVH